MHGRQGCRLCERQQENSTCDQDSTHPEDHAAAQGNQASGVSHCIINLHIFLIHCFVHTIRLKSHTLIVRLSICRAIEDYAVVYLGSAIFKIARLLIVATSCVHLFACAFHRVKVESAYAPEDVTAFYTSRGIEDTVNLPVLLNCLVMIGRNVSAPCGTYYNSRKFPQPLIDLLAFFDRISGVNM